MDAFEIDLVLAPQPADDLEPLIGLAAARLGVEVQGPPFGCQRAADPESGQQAPFGQHVDCRALLGQQHRIAERQGQHVDAKFEPTRASGECRHHAHAFEDRLAADHAIGLP